MPMVTRRSGLQKEVLLLYRKLLKTTATKPVEHQPALRAIIKQEFQENKTLPRNQTAQIEYMLKKGKKKLDLLETPGVVGYSQ